MLGLNVAVILGALCARREISDLLASSTSPLCCILVGNRGAMRPQRALRLQCSRGRSSVLELSEVLGLGIIQELSLSQ